MMLLWHHNDFLLNKATLDVTVIWNWIIFVSLEAISLNRSHFSGIFTMNILVTPVFNRFLGTKLTTVLKMMRVLWRSSQQISEMALITENKVKHQKLSLLSFSMEEFIQDVNHLAFFKLAVSISFGKKKDRNCSWTGKTQIDDKCEQLWKNSFFQMKQNKKK